AFLDKPDAAASPVPQNAFCGHSPPPSFPLHPENPPTLPPSEQEFPIDTGEFSSHILPGFHRPEGSSSFCHTYGRNCWHTSAVLPASAEWWTHPETPHV